jgi:two-component system NtrC family sensor kinase
LFGSRTQLTHVLINLIMNATQAIADAGRDKEGRIHVTGRCDDDQMKLTVWDNGKGIPANNLDRVFEPFFTTRQVGDGIGLGLSICHTILRNHGGELTCRSEPGAWTEFCLVLPAHESRQAFGEPSAASASRA